MYFELLRVARETRSSTPHHFERRCIVRAGWPQELVLAGPLAKTLSCPKIPTLLFQSEEKLQFCVLFRDIFPQQSSPSSSRMSVKRNLSFLFGLRSSGFQVTCRLGAVQRMRSWIGALLVKYACRIIDHVRLPAYPWQDLLWQIFNDLSGKASGSRVRSLIVLPRGFTRQEWCRAWLVSAWFDGWADQKRTEYERWMLVLLSLCPSDVRLDAFGWRQGGTFDSHFSTVYF